MSDFFKAEDIEIVISGGGIGGLACALALQQRGFLNITVFEKDSQFDDRKQGYGLTLTNNEKGPLAKLNILEEVLSNDCPSYQHWVFKSSGEVCGYYGRIFKPVANDETLTPSSSSRGNIRIPRQVLRKILLDKLKPGTVQWNRKIKEFHENTDGVDIFLEQQIKCDISDSISTIRADLLIGADGIHSVVRNLRDKYNSSKNHILNQSQLKYVGVSVIIGLSTACHEFINEGGFYVLDGVHRLFVMPFREANKSRNNNNNNNTTDDDEKNASDNGHDRCQLTMWQLSFSGLTESEGITLKNQSQLELQVEALRRTKDWFSPVQALITQTALSEIWTTPLYDRDAMIMTPKHKRNDGKKGNYVEDGNDNSEKQRKRKLSNNNKASSDVNDKIQPSEIVMTNKGMGLTNDTSTAETKCIPTINPTMSRVTVLGDACHPMSMFKGQGCNQALEDGPLLSSWLSKPGLTRTNIFTRLRCFEREMIGRTSSKVLASRQAAQLYHSLHAVTEVDYGFEGIHNKNSSSNNKELIYKNISAANTYNKSNDGREISIEVQSQSNNNTIGYTNTNGTDGDEAAMIDKAARNIKTDSDDGDRNSNSNSTNNNSCDNELTLFLEQLKLQQINASLGSELKPTLLNIIHTIRNKK